MKKLLLIASILLFNLNSFSQAPSIEWQKTYGLEGWEEANCIQKTSDGGYVIAGEVTGGDGGGFLVVKINNTGVLQWQKRYGGSSAIEAAYSIQQTSDGGYIVAGHTSSTDGDVTGNHGGTPDFWVIKINSIGTLQWQKTLGGNNNDFAYSVQQTTDGGYIVAGVTSSVDGDITFNHGNENDDYWIVKLNSTGVVQWQKTLGGTNNDIARSIQQTADGGYIITGEAVSDDGDVLNDLNGAYGNAWVVKLDSTGNIQWQKTLEKIINHATEGYSIQQTTDGGYIMVGQTLSVDYLNWEYYVVKMNASGIVEWQNSYGGTLNDYAYSVKQTTDGGYIVAGSTRSTGGDVSGNNGIDDYWLIKLNSAGTLLWQKALGGSLIDVANSVLQTSDGGYIVAGSSRSNNGDVTNNIGSNPIRFWVVKLAGPGASCTVPTALTTSVFETNVTVDWSQSANPDNTTAATWEILVLPCGSTPSSSKARTTVTAHPYTITNLNPQTCYDFYVRAKCSPSDLSEWSAVSSATTQNAHVDVCGSTFVDSGASGNYGINENTVYTFCPDILGQKITVTFTLFSLEERYDALYVFNGIGTSAPQILSSNGAESVPGGLPGGFWGFNVPGPFVSTSADGCLTFRFISDFSGNFAGWSANVTCSNLATAEFEQQTMALYPNPAKTILNIHVLNQTVPDRVAVTDLTGKILLQTQNTKEINVADLASGIYIIEAVSGDKKFTRKFVKE